MKKINQLYYAICLTVFGWFISNPVLAQVDIQDKLDQTARQPFGDSAVDTKQSIGTVVGNAANYILGFTGTVTFIMILYGGFMWGTARGDEQQVKDAKKIITRGVIGTIVVIFAWSIAYFVTTFFSGT